jgi:hypothetical protein
MAKIKFTKAGDQENEHEIGNGVDSDGRPYEGEPAGTGSPAASDARSERAAEVDAQGPISQERIQIGKGIVFNPEGLEESSNSQESQSAQPEQPESVSSPSESSGYSGSEIKKAGGSPDKGVRFTKEGIRAKFVQSGAVVAPPKSRAKKLPEQEDVKIPENKLKNKDKPFYESEVDAIAKSYQAKLDDKLENYRFGKIVD